MKMMVGYREAIQEEIHLLGKEDLKILNRAEEIIFIQVSIIKGSPKSKYKAVEIWNETLNNLGINLKEGKWEHNDQGEERNKLRQLANLKILSRRGFRIDRKISIYD